MSVNKNDMKKKAVVFGGTDGHGVVMTGLSGRNLESEKFECRMVCEFIFLPQNQTELFKKKFWGTGNAGLFWGITFPNYSFSDLKEGDLVIVVDIPLGVDDRFPYLSLDGALKCIKDLTERVSGYHHRSPQDGGNLLRNGSRSGSRDRDILLCGDHSLWDTR